MTDSIHPAAVPFYTAACNGDLEEAERIRAANPELTRESLHAAAVFGDGSALDELLVDERAANAGVGNGLVPLFLLAHSVYADEAGGRAAELADVARRLLAAGAETATSRPDADVPGGERTVLSGAAGWIGSIEVCRALLDGGAAPDDEAALAVAVAGGHFACADLLVERGANPNAEHAALHWMLDVHYSLEGVEWLLAHGADPNRRVGALRESALYVAVRRRRLEPLDALVAAGGEVDLETTGEMTPYRHALRRRFTEIVKKLASLGADTTTTASDELAVVLQAGELERAGELLAQSPELARDARPEEARLLPDLAGYSKVDAMRLLLDAGADITARGLDGGTALHQAAWFGQPAAARFLIERGAPLDVRGDVHDCTPLGWVTHGSRFSGGADERVEVYVELAEMLLAAGAPFPTSDEGHDRQQHTRAVPEVRDVLRRNGWEG